MQTTETDLLERAHYAARGIFHERAKPPLHRHPAAVQRLLTEAFLAGHKAAGREEARFPRVGAS